MTRPLPLVLGAALLWLPAAPVTVLAADGAPKPSPQLAQADPEDSNPDVEADPGQPVEPDEPLDDQLQDSEGVIEPPATGDAEIHVPAPDPDPGTTPVIPPPGTPGGDPTVEPR